MKRASSATTDWGKEPSATRRDLKQLAFALLLLELVVAGLAVATRAFFGARTALWVGFGIGGLILAAFVLVTLFGVVSHGVAALLARRETRKR